jgi:hypothetical protein
MTHDDPPHEHPALPLLRALLARALDAGSHALDALMPLMPEAAQRHYARWAPAIAALTSLIQTLKRALATLAPLLIAGDLDQRELNDAWQTTLAEAQRLVEHAPTSDEWLNTLEILDAWIGRLLQEKYGQRLVATAASRLEHTINDLVSQLIDLLLSPEAETQAQAWTDTIHRAEQLAQRFIDQVILPRLTDDEDTSP